MWRSYRHVANVWAALDYPQGMNEREAASARSRTPAPRTDRTRIRRHADRAVPDRVEEFLRTGRVAHLALVEHGEPRVIPFLYHYEAGCIYVHGSPGNATLRLLRDGRPVTVAVTELVALVASKTAANHSADYRSVIAYGRGRQVVDVTEKRRILDLMTERYFPGRRAGPDYAPATDADLEKMELTEIAIDEASAKMRDMGAAGPGDSDPDVPGSAFVEPG
jgi:nitroimidazol reductase NimA-like FMN-containing flavoprotein (pyridoxamine 5'-phosphate oxidase superfamily)